MFSRRARLDSGPTPLAERLDRARQAGGLSDLSESNPTRCGFDYPWAEIAAALSDARAAAYHPEPFGLLSARQAVASLEGVSPDDVILTASTSEAYGFLLKLLCDPGDRVLTFRPGYPLLEYLARLEGVQVDQLELHRDAGWAIDLEELSARAGPGTRALLAVSPANPTGQYLRRHELEALQRTAAARDAALIVDEVFSAYPRAPLGPDQVHRASSFPGAALTVSLSGLSKLAGLPQLKLGWMVFSGPDDLRREARRRLELIADVALSVATPVQVALPRLLELGRQVRSQIQQRVDANLRRLHAVRPADAPWSILPVEAGWSVVLRLPRHPGAEATAEKLLDAGVWAQPGYLFDFGPTGEYLVASLLPAPDVFGEGARRLVDVLGRPLPAG